jgi:hypothetical protein
VAAVKGGSADIEFSASRVEGSTKQLQEKWGVKVYDSIEEMCQHVDAVMLESVDGRPPLAQAKPVIFDDSGVHGSGRWKQASRWSEREAPVYPEEEWCGIRQVRRPPGKRRPATGCNSPAHILWKRGPRPRLEENLRAGQITRPSSHRARP